MAAFTNAKQSVPGIFVEIMRNHAERALLREPAIIPFENARRYNTLQKEMQEYRNGAEKALRWNTDKGNSG